MILSLLALGLSDRRIAAQLGLSLRTVERRIRALMDLADAQSRFQLGCHAAREGWLPDERGSGCAVTKTADRDVRPKDAGTAVPRTRWRASAKAADRRAQTRRT